MPITVEQYLEGLELSAEDKAIVAKALGNEKNLKELEGRGLRQSEFSKRMDELTAKQNEAATKAQQAAEYYQTVNKWRMEKETEFNSTVEDRIKAIRPQLISSGLTDEEADKILGGTAVSIKRGDPNPANGNGNVDFVTRKQIGELERQYAALPALYMQIGAEHSRLFGADSQLDWEPMVKKSLESGKSLRETWEETYKVPDKRSEIAKAAHDKEINEAIDRGKKTAMDEFYAKNPDLLNRVTNPSMPTPLLHDIAKRNLEAHPDLKGAEAGGDAARLKRVTDAVAKWPEVLAKANG